MTFIFMKVVYIFIELLAVAHIKVWDFLAALKSNWLAFSCWFVVSTIYFQFLCSVLLYCIMFNSHQFSDKKNHQNGFKITWRYFSRIIIIYKQTFTNNIDWTNKAANKLFFYYSIPYFALVSLKHGSILKTNHL